MLTSSRILSLFLYLHGFFFFTMHLSVNYQNRTKYWDSKTIAKRQTLRYVLKYQDSLTLLCFSCWHAWLCSIVFSSLILRKIQAEVTLSTSVCSDGKEGQGRHVTVMGSCLLLNCEIAVLDSLQKPGNGWLKVSALRVKCVQGVLDRKNQVLL